MFLRAIQTVDETKGAYELKLLHEGKAVHIQSSLKIEDSAFDEKFGMRAYKQPMLERKVQVLCFDQTLAEAQIRGKLSDVKKGKSLREDIKKLFQSNQEVGDTFEVQLVWKDQVTDPS